MVRCKVSCNYIQTFKDGGSTIQFCPVYTGSLENEKFYKSTPGGSCGGFSFYTVNPEAAAKFERGKEYYLDFTPAN